jgi:hypothetical protein
MPVPHARDFRIRLLQQELVRPQVAPSAGTSDLIRLNLPTICSATEESFVIGTPEEIGRLFSMLHKASAALAMFTLQAPDASELLQFCTRWVDYIRMRCPNMPLDGLNLQELVTWITHSRENARGNRAGYAQQEDEITLDTPEAIEVARLRLCHIDEGIFFAFTKFNQHRIRQHFNPAQRTRLASSFAHEDRDDDGMFAVHMFEFTETAVGDGTPVEFQVNNSTLEYGAVGEPIPLSAFCRPTTTVPDETNCSICMSEIETTQVNKPIVVTRCEHIFHQECLNTWVNNSAMETSNTCPACRTQMCEPRQRAHQSVLQDQGFWATDFEGNVLWQGPDADGNNW